VGGAISASFAMIMIYVRRATKQERQLPVIQQNIQCSAFLQGLISVSMLVVSDMLWSMWFLGFMAHGVRDVSFLLFWTFYYLQHKQGFTCVLMHIRGMEI